MKTLRMWSSSMQYVGPFIHANRRALFWRCKRVASERECIWYPYTRGPKNLPKKVPKKAFRATLESTKYIVAPQNHHVCKLQKLKNAKTGRIESPYIGCPWGGRVWPYYILLLTLQKNIFSTKNLIFVVAKQNWTLAPNFGASLPRPNWPIPESLLLFYKLFSKSDAAAPRDAISA